MKCAEHELVTFLAASPPDERLGKMFCLKFCSQISNFGSLVNRLSFYLKDSSSRSLSKVLLILSNLFTPLWTQSFSAFKEVEEYVDEGRVLF